MVVNRSIVEKTHPIHKPRNLQSSRYNQSAATSQFHFQIYNINNYSNLWQALRLIQSTFGLSTAPMQRLNIRSDIFDLHLPTEQSSRNKVNKGIGRRRPRDWEIPAEETLKSLSRDVLKHPIKGFSEKM
jgi:hypothetical protein